MADEQLMDVALRVLLARHPDAVVAAIDEDGLFVTVPASVPLDGHRVSQARSALDLVAPEDRAKVIDAWARARAEGGGALAMVRVAGSGGARAALHLSDVRSTHGVYMCALVPVEGSDDPLEEAARIVAAPPRLLRTRKSELSVLLEVDDDVPAVLGWRPDEMVGKRSLDYIHPDDHAQAIDTWMEVLSKPGSTCASRLRHRHRDGRWVWLEISNRNLLDVDGAGYVDCSMLDISEEMEALEAVRASEQLFRRLAGALPVGVVQIDLERNLVYANDELYRIFGASGGTPGGQLLARVVDLDALDATLTLVLGGADADVEVLVDRLDGSGRRRCTLALRALTAPEGTVTGAVGSWSDVTDASRMRAELEQRATYDELTGCVNRSTAMATLAGVLAAPGQDTAVAFIDLDRFKDVNDRLGHRVGDALLVAVADRLRTVVRAGDVVGRIGGDEFLVICPNVTGPPEGLQLAERIAEAIVGPVCVDDMILEASASVGVAWAPGTVDADALIARADAAMYESKRSGGGRAVLAGGDANVRRPSNQPVPEAAGQVPVGSACSGDATVAAIARR